MRRRAVNIAASGAAFSAVTTDLMSFSGFQGQEGVASRATDRGSYVLRGWAYLQV